MFFLFAAAMAFWSATAVYGGLQEFNESGVVNPFAFAVAVFFALISITFSVLTLDRD